MKSRNEDEERMMEAGMGAVERNEVFLAELERRVSEAESRFNSIENTKESTRFGSSNTRTNIKEKSDRAIHGRAESQPALDGNSNRAGSIENCSDNNIASKPTTTRREINVKTDRAILVRAEIASENKIGDTPNLSNEVNSSKDSEYAYFSEPFDLLGGDGRLLATIGFETISGFHVLFSDEEFDPLSSFSKKQIFSTSEDDQSKILIPLAIQFGAGQIINIGNYAIDGICLAPRGIPRIETTIEIGNFEIKIKASDLLNKSDIRIIKEA